MAGTNRKDLNDRSLVGPEVSRWAAAWCGLRVALIGSVLVGLAECSAAGWVSLEHYAADAWPWRFLFAAAGKAVVTHVLAWGPLFALAGLLLAPLAARRSAGSPLPILAAGFVLLTGCLIAPFDLLLAERDTVGRIVGLGAAGCVGAVAQVSLAATHGPTARTGAVEPHAESRRAGGIRDPGLYRRILCPVTLAQSRGISFSASNRSEPQSGRSPCAVDRAGYGAGGPHEPARLCPRHDAPAGCVREGCAGVRSGDCQRHLDASVAHLDVHRSKRVGTWCGSSQSANARGSGDGG
jgi:hypothetical protein